MKKLQDRREALETEIAGLEERKSSLELELAEPETYKIADRPAELKTAIDEINTSIAKAYKEWEKLLEYD